MKPGPGGTLLLAALLPGQDLHLRLDVPDDTWLGAQPIADGVSGAAARFAGGDARIDVGPCPIDGNAPLWLGCWLRTTHGGFCTPLMARDGERVGVSLVLGREPGRISLELWSWASVRLQSRVRIDDGAWHRIEAAYDPDTTLALLFVDGALQAAAEVGPGGAPAARLRLGDNIGAHQPFRGDLDEVELRSKRTHADRFEQLAPVLPRAERQQALAALREAALPRSTPSLEPAALPQWPARRQAVRAHALDCLGLAPPPADVPSAAMVHGALERDGVRIERISLQGFPGRRATGWLWRPAAATAAPAPAVLCPHGHWPDGALHPVVQARCASFARLGLCALAMDSIHTEAIAAGASPAQAMAWHNLRALAFLRARPDVDPARIAATGCSGGGQQTFLLMALSDDLAAAAPICMVCHYGAILADDSAHCGCNHVPRLGCGTDVPELCAVFAPRPVLFGSVTGDWTADFPAQGLPGLRRLWGSLQRDDALRSLHRDEGHDYSQPMREAVYGFFAAVFAGAPAPARAPPIAEAPFEPWPAAALRALGGPPRAELLDDQEAARELLARRPRLQEPRALAPALPWQVTARPLELRSHRGGFDCGVVRGHDGVPVPFSLRGRDAAGRWTVVVDGRGMAMQRAGLAGADAEESLPPRLACVDPRFLGEWSPFAAAWRRNGILLGRGELYEAAHDVALLCHSLPGEDRVTLLARHGSAPVAVVAAWLCHRIDEIGVDSFGPDYGAAPNRTPLAPEVLRLGGLDWFASALRRRGVAVATGVR